MMDWKLTGAGQRGVKETSAWQQSPEVSAEDVQSSWNAVGRMGDVVESTQSPLPKLPNLAAVQEASHLAELAESEVALTWTGGAAGELLPPRTRAIHSCTPFNSPPRETNIIDTLLSPTRGNCFHGFCTGPHSTHLIIWAIVCDVHSGDVDSGKCTSCWSVCDAGPRIVTEEAPSSWRKRISNPTFHGTPSPTSSR